MLAIFSLAVITIQTGRLVDLYHLNKSILFEQIGSTLSMSLSRRCRQLEFDIAWGLECIVRSRFTLMFYLRSNKFSMRIVYFECIHLLSLPFQSTHIPYVYVTRSCGA